MFGWIQQIYASFETWVGLTQRATNSEKLRARLICITCLSFMVTEIICFAGAYWFFDGFVRQHALLAVLFSSKCCLILVLRRTKNPALLAWAVAATSMIGIWFATFIDHYGQDSSFEIGAAYTPFMIVSLVLVGLIGTRSIIVSYSLICLATLVAFFVTGHAFFYTDQVTSHAQLGLVLRMTSVIVTAVIMLPVAKVIYQSLENLESAYQRAKSADIARANFMSTMSHEIRTPLNGILGLSDLLSRSDLTAQQSRYAGLITRSSNSLMEIIDEVLDMARLEDGAVTISADPFDIRMLLQDTSDLFSMRATEKSLWLGSHVDESIPYELIGDAPHLRQILNNLTSNALKFTQEGGVRIGARCVKQDGDVMTIQFYVQDSGVGIAPEDQAKVFTRFGQSESAKSTSAKGTGLGLSICQELTEMMGGVLSLSSERGRGSVFHFTLDLPIAESHAPVVKSAA